MARSSKDSAVEKPIAGEGENAQSEAVRTTTNIERANRKRRKTVEIKKLYRDVCR